MNELEEAFDNGYRKYLEKKYMRIVQRDFPMRTKTKQIVDRLLISKSKNLAFELKQTKGNRFDFNRLKPHQQEFLEQFQISCGEAFLMVSFNEMQIVFLIPIRQYIWMKSKTEKVSMNVEELQAYHTKEIKAYLLRTHYRLDFSEAIR